MEDQPADTGDLTAAASVPQGKAARTRHRLPRQKLRQEGQDGATEPVATADADAPTESDPGPDSDVVDTPAADVDAEVDAPVAEPEVDAPVAEPTQKRRRFPWRRTAPAAPAEVSAVEEPETTAEVEALASEAERDSETTESEAPEPTEALEPTDEVDEEQAEPEPEPILVPHRTAGRALKVATVVAGVLFVGATAFAGSTLQPYLADRATVHTKFEIAETAADAITTLWTYTPDDMDALPDRAGRFLAGDFAVEYRRYIDAIVESNKQAQVSNSTQVLGAAVESLSPTEASAIVYTNSVATSPRTKGIPSLRYLSYRLDMELRNRQWLITKMTAITSLDLTPRL